MTSYDSSKSGHLHPHHAQAPPYPSTPAPAPGPYGQSYPPRPQAQDPGFFSSSPPSNGYPTAPGPRRRSSSTYSHHSTHSQPPRRNSGAPLPMPIPIRPGAGGNAAGAYSGYNNSYAGSATGSHANSYYGHQNAHTMASSYPPQQAPAPVIYAQPGPPVYARAPSHASYFAGSGAHDPHAFADGEDKYEAGGRDAVYGPIDEETERAYEKRYQREKRAERELESRPTLGGSVLSMVGKLGFGGGRNRRE